MSMPKLTTHAGLVLIVDDVLENLAVLHDALDESGYTVLVANNGHSALQRARDAQPDIILLDAIMPELDGFQVCQQLKIDMNTRHIPVVFMTGLTEAEHVAAAFEVGGTDYVTKPIRPKEVLARIASHLHTAKMMHQARSALDAFGQAAIAVTPHDGKVVWQTPLARQWLQDYFKTDFPLHEAITPTPLHNWISLIYSSSIPETQTLTIIQGAKRLIFSASDLSNEEQWIVLLREESDSAQIEALMLTFKLTKRESEVLYWAIKGKTNRDIGDILGTSPRTVNKHLEHVFAKLGVETRTAAASLAASKLRIANK
jgi:CheY-like chemotaxis protein/DNA-binding CsgD family transcriptional regulator